MLKFIKGGVVGLSISSILVLAACGGGGSNANIALPPGGDSGGGSGSTTFSSNNFGGPGSGGQVFGSFFGVNQIHLAPCDSTPFAGPFTDAPVAAVRFWDTCKSQWPDLEPSAGVYNFNNLDTIMAAAKAGGVNDVIMEVGRIPNWISSSPGDMDCDAAGVNGELPGLCDPPTDVALDGTGTDATFIAFAQALLSHAVAQSYPLKYLEIFEEFHRSDSLTGGVFVCSAPGAGIPCSWRGTYAQMLRMTQDLRCVAKGIASDPITATGLTCGTSNYGNIGIMPSLNVSVGNAGPENLEGVDGSMVMANYLYCNQNPSADSVCNYGSTAGSASTDMIGGHAYFQTNVPETVLTAIAEQHGLLSATDQAKPYFIGEGGWNQNTNVQDAGLEAAFVARWYMSLWMSDAVKRGYWWSWDLSGSQGDAGLWSASSQSFGDCTTADPNADGGFYCADGVAFNQMVGWLRNATKVSWTCPDTTCTNQVPGVYTLNVTGANGYQAVVSWDSSTVPSCPAPPCGNAALPDVLSGFTASQWRDLTGATHTGAPTAVGASPIIVENMAPPSS